MHIHTPESVESYYGDGQQASTWEKYLAALANLPPEIKAVGINDYFTIAGYKRVRQAHAEGRLPNLHLVLPVVELRLTHLAGNTALQKLNHHVVFSDDVSPDDIENFFLRQLHVKLHLADGPAWQGCVGTKEGLISLGEAVKKSTPQAIVTDSSLLEAGFASAALDYEVVDKALQDSVFRGRFLTAVGVGEWSQIRWTGAGAAQKRDVINRADFVYTAAPSVAQYYERKRQLTEDEVNDRLIDASDAHYFSDSSQSNRLGQTYTWIKADLTFQGLRRALRRFNDRVFVGNIPTKVERVRTRKTKYIRHISIKKKEGSTLGETWFDVDIPINHDLVAIIGNQGSGKSALTDVLALCGQSHLRPFSFLNPDKFRSEKNKRAAEFVATLQWEDDSDPIVMTLDQDPPSASVERVRYVPQGFFDTITNEVAVSEEGKFYGEIKKAIFSHIPSDDRLECNSLDELLGRHSTSFQESLSEHRKDLRELNRRIVMGEAMCAQASIDALKATIVQREQEIAILESSPPNVVPGPTEQDDVAIEIEKLRTSQEVARGRIQQLEGQRAQLKQRRSIVDNALRSLQNEERQFQTAVERVQLDLDAIGESIQAADALTVSANYSAIRSRLKAIDDEIRGADALLNPDSDDSLVVQLKALTAKRQRLEQTSVAATNAYQSYLNALEGWRTRVAALRGDESNPASDSLNGLKKRYHALTVAGPAALIDLESRRRKKTNEIYSVLSGLGTLYEQVVYNVRHHIATEKLTSKHYRLAFDIRLGDVGLANRLFSFVAHQTGTFHGQQEGRGRLKSLIDNVDFTNSGGALAFADTLLDQLKRDHRSPGLEAVDLVRCLRKGSTLEDVYNLVYGLEYLSPTFELSLNGKPLRLLSPGERGILLLVFYLVVDRGDEPLIIDQPEGNLNNQSIVKHLVPVFMAAKQRRQIIIVTHNPNIAVVCDAEQIISCEIDQDEFHRVTYRAGAIENPTFNELSLDLLEGTAVALDARVDTYDEMENQRSGVRLKVFDWDPVGQVGDGQDQLK